MNHRALKLSLTGVLGIPSIAAAGLYVIPEDYASINAALSVSTVGDTVFVMPGNYEESVQIPQGVTVLSQGGRSETAIHGPNGVPAVTFLAGVEAASIEGFVIFCEGSFNPPTIVSHNPNCWVMDSQTATGGPVLWGNPGLLFHEGGNIIGCELRHSSESGYIALSEPGSSLLVEDCMFWEYIYPLGLDGTPEGATLTYKNNTFYQADADLTVYQGNSTTAFDLVFENNIIVDPMWFWPSGSSYPEEFVIRHTCWWPFDPAEYGVFPEETLGPGNFLADPLFCVEPMTPENPPKEGWLDSTSPCLGSGWEGEDVGARYGVCGVSSAPTQTDTDSDMLKLVANPTVGSVRFSTSTFGWSGSVRVLDAEGRVVVERAVRWTEGPLSYAVDLSDVAAGVYFLEVVMATDFGRKKFVLLSP